MALIFPISWLIDWSPKRRSRRQVAQAAADIALRLLPPVWQLVALPAASMGPDETRGYVRARAQHVVRPEVESMLRGRPRLQSSREALYEQAMDRIVSLVLRDLSHPTGASGAQRRAA